MNSRKCREMDTSPQNGLMRRTIAAHFERRISIVLLASIIFSASIAFIVFQSPTNFVQIESPYQGLSLFNESTGRRNGLPLLGGTQSNASDSLLERHVALTQRDTISNRCFLTQHESQSMPCRPLLGAVQKKFRTGLLPLATQVVVSDAYRFIYLKTRKVAGTSIFTGYFRAVLCAPKEGDEVVDNFFGIEPPVPVQKNCSRELLDPPLDQQILPPAIDKIPLTKLHNYFVFAAARNPYERAVSSYEYCALHRSGSFSEFTRNPLSLGSRCGGSASSALGQTLANPHWDPQIQEMCDATGTNCIVDYVVDTDRLAPMMDEVVHRINAGRNMSFAPLPKFSDVGKKLNSGMKRNYSKHYRSCPECRQQVFDYYKEDVVMFGYGLP